MKSPFIQRIVEHIDDLHKIEFVFNDTYLNEVIVSSRQSTRHRKWKTEIHWLWTHLAVNNEKPPALPSQATIDACVTELRAQVTYVGIRCF